jgi:transcriptional regulator with XRE-family HTH domain
MSYFGTALKDLLQRKNMKAVRLAELSGVSQPMISRYIAGEDRRVSPEDVAALAESISDNPTEQAEIFRGHLMDECAGSGLKLLDIQIRGRADTLAEPAPAYQVPLPGDLQQHLDTIRQWLIHDRDVREIIEGLGKLLAGKTPSEASSESREKEVLKLAKTSYRKRIGRPGAPPEGSQ